ncbi:uncharacterized protein DUF664 [Knoellia remsis]|uniref:Uncharacterized protein DUF664 n=1 Tax=Knoellia remsis TaxID=407159 RepID=A0A2T0U836_9MICO|nr:DUF664 domain-containing protein [Knoellia remsis]PRY54018.1 uncharacterized protein DUF664 [Knoellia remsis]
MSDPVPGSDVTPWEPLDGDEADHVLGALERLRWTFRWKADDLGAQQLQATVGASSLSLGGLLKHLAVQEDHAFAAKIAGEPMPDAWADNGWDENPDWEIDSAADDDPQDLYRAYDAAVERSRERLAAPLAAGGLDRPAAITTDRGERVGRRRVLLDLVEEYGRHTGHADLLREAVDGRTGEDPPDGWRPTS